MKTYTITLEVDQGWLDTIRRLTNVDEFDGEVIKWLDCQEN